MEDTIVRKSGAVTVENGSRPETPIERLKNIGVIVEDAKTILPVDHGIQRDEIYDDLSALDRWIEAVTGKSPEVLPKKESLVERARRFENEHYDIVSFGYVTGLILAFAGFIYVVDMFHGKCQ